jgi:hypothetical protein
VCLTAAYVPNTSDDTIVARYDYDQVQGGSPYAGQFYDQVTDNKGIKTRTYYDLLGRTTRTVANYVDGVDEEDTDADQTTEYLYDSAGRLAAQRACNPKGLGNGVENQDTRYLYESAIDRSWATSAIAPDSADTDSMGTDQVKTVYDRLGREASVVTSHIPWQRTEIWGRYP